MRFWRDLVSRFKIDDGDRAAPTTRAPRPKKVRPRPVDEESGARRIRAAASPPALPPTGTDGFEEF